MASYKVSALAKKVYQDAGKHKPLGALMELRTGLPAAKSEDTDDAPLLVREIVLLFEKGKALAPKFDDTTQRRAWAKFKDGSLFEASVSETAYNSAWESLMTLAFEVSPKVEPVFPETLDIATAESDEPEPAEETPAPKAAGRKKKADPLAPPKASVKTPAALIAKNATKKTAKK